MLGLVAFTLCLKVEPLAHSFFNLHHYTAAAYNLANYTDTFCTSIAGLHYLCCEDIVSEIAQKDLSVLATLDIPQIEEEILKMKLSSNPSWGNAIDNAEKDLSYFEGRLRYPLIECCSALSNDVTPGRKPSV